MVRDLIIFFKLTALAIALLNKFWPVDNESIALLASQHQTRISAEAFTKQNFSQPRVRAVRTLLDPLLKSERATLVSRPSATTKCGVGGRVGTIRR